MKDRENPGTLSSAAVPPGGTINIELLGRGAHVRPSARANASSTVLCAWAGVSPGRFFTPIAERQDTHVEVAAAEAPGPIRNRVCYEYQL